MTERVLSQVQASDRIFANNLLRSAQLWNSQNLNVEPMARSRLRWFDQNVSVKTSEASPAGFTLSRPRSWPSTRWRNYISDLACPVVVWSQQNYLKLLKTVTYLSPPMPAVPRPSPDEKRVWNTNEWIHLPLRKPRGPNDSNNVHVYWGNQNAWKQFCLQVFVKTAERTYFLFYGCMVDSPQ